MQAVPLLAPCELARRRLRRLCGLRPAVAGAATPASLRPCRASNPAVCRAQVSLHLYPMKVRYKNPDLLHFQIALPVPWPEHRGAFTVPVKVLPSDDGILPRL